MDPHGQFQDVCDAEENAWLDRSGLKLDWFARSSLTVSMREVATVKNRGAVDIAHSIYDVMGRDVLVSFSGALNLNSNH